MITENDQEILDGFKRMEIAHNKFMKKIREN